MDNPENHQPDQDKQPRPKIPPPDVEKLHAEGLQLRNQQFFIATLALTGASFISIFFKNFVAGNPDHLLWPMIKVVMIFAIWLSLLVFLFHWSLNLHKLLTITSEFLKVTRASVWEDWFFKFSAHLDENGKEWKCYGGKLKSQTRIVQQAYRAYGAIPLFFVQISLWECCRQSIEAYVVITAPVAWFIIYWFCLSKLIENHKKCIKKLRDEVKGLLDH